MRLLRERNNVTPMLQNVTHNKSKEIEIEKKEEYVPAVETASPTKTQKTQIRNIQKCAFN